MNNSLVGKYFLATIPFMGSGIVEAIIDGNHYLVRYDADGGMPEHFMVVAISDMVRAGFTGDDDQPPPWTFFDTIEQRTKFQAWMNEPADPNKPRLVPFKPR